MTTESIAPAEVSGTDERWLRKLVVVAVMTALADWLFFGHALGISAVVFVLALAVGVLVASPTWATRREMLTAAAILCAALLPFVEAPTVLSWLFCIAGAAYFALTASARATGPLYENAAAALWLIVVGPFLIFPDLGRVCHLAKRGGVATSVGNVVVGWTVPFVLGAIFLGLFASANPVIERWFMDWSLRDSMGRIDVVRILFWAIAIVAVWPFVCVTRAYLEQARTAVVSELKDPVDVTWPPRLLGDAAILRSLVVFNLLFALQTVMDINYLWRGAQLPAGMNYADYAHRGAYPLILTALLAAGFVIAAMRPGSAAERSPLMRTLVFLWTAQNVLLVVSSMLRLNLYVEAYSLTYLRVAAFIWMLLVAVGLVLIVARYPPLPLQRLAGFAQSGARWRSRSIVCGFINFPDVIASYNVAAQPRDVRRKAWPLDVDYLLESRSGRSFRRSTIIVARAAVLSLPRQSLCAAGHARRVSPRRHEGLARLEFSPMAARALPGGRGPRHDVEFFDLAVRVRPARPSPA